MSYQADRHWRAYLWAALLVGAIGGALPLLSLIPSPLSPSPTPGELPAAALSSNGILFASVAALLTLLVAGRGVVGWGRMQLRNRALHGDPNALPESTIQPDTTDVFDVAHEPLVLVWRMQRSSSGLPTSLGTAIFLHLAGVLTSWLVIIGLVLVGDRWFPVFASPLLISLVLVIVAVLGSIGTAVIARLSGRRLSSDQLTIVEALSEGIRFQPIIGPVRLMRWEDIRLLEVEEQRSTRLGKEFVTRFYALSDCQQAVITWVEWSAQEVRVPQPEDITWDEMWALSHEVVDVIYQRTGLVPRTFTRSRQRRRADALEPIPLGGEETQEYPGTSS